MVALFGREKDIEVIGRFLAGAAVDGDALLITGPAGVGRTAVLDAAAAMASAAGALVVRADGVEDEADFPFAGLSQLLAPLDGVLERLDPDHRAALSAVTGQDDGHPLDRAVVVVALIAALESAAGTRPVVVAVDDLPTMDVPSAECLRSLARNLSGHRIGLLATARTPGLGGGLPEHRLSPLAEDAAAALLATRAPRLPRADRDRVLREAEGNPLALRELPLRPGQPLGPRLASLFGDRVAALPVASRRLLLRAALADVDDLDVLPGAGAPVPGAPVLDELRRAERAGLIRVAGRRVLFAHPAVRATVNATAAPPGSR